MRSHRVTGPYLLDSLDTLCGQSTTGACRGHTHARPGKGQQCGYRSLRHRQEAGLLCRDGLVRKLLYLLDQGWDDVGDAPKSHVGGSQDRTSLVLSGRLLAWRDFRLWLLGIQVTQHVRGRRGRRRLGAYPRKEEARSLPSSRRAPFSRKPAASRRDAPWRRSRLVLTVPGVRGAAHRLPRAWDKGVRQAAFQPDSPACRAVQGEALKLPVQLMGSS